MFALPAIVFFRAFGEEAVIYTGDLKREESILEWLMVQKDPSNDAIEEMEGDDLRKTIEGSDAIAVFICKLISCIDKTLASSLFTLSQTPMKSVKTVWRPCQSWKTLTMMWRDRKSKCRKLLTPPSLRRSV